MNLLILLKKFWYLPVLLLMSIVIYFWWRNRMTQDEEPEPDEVNRNPQTGTQGLQSKNQILRTDLLLLLHDKLTAAGYDEKLAQMILAQALHETGNLSSNLFVNYNNPWGMMQPLKRKTTSKGATPSGFASYANLSDAVDDFIYYLDNFKYEKSYPDVRTYVAELKKKGYFTDTFTNYYAATQKWYNSLSFMG